LSARGDPPKESRATRFELQLDVKTSTRVGSVSYREWATGVTAQEIQFRQQRRREEEDRKQWYRAELLLAVLRPIEASPIPPDKLFARWCETKNRSVLSTEGSVLPTENAEQTFGPLILSATQLNLEVIAASLGAFFNIVHSPVEGSWFFEDYSVGAYRPVSPGKVGLFVSALITRRAMCETDPLRSRILALKDSAGDIVRIAEALLAADSEFFRAELGARRYVDGKLVLPVAAPSYSLFAEEAVEPRPGSILTAAEAYQGYFVFCRQNQEQPLRRMQFRQKFTDETLSRWGIGMRNDLLVGEKPKNCQGWKGLSLRSAFSLN
jgi:hypothetical protein